nr:transposase (putative), gypsy type [Tanacetum cinerariifolium]
MGLLDFVKFADPFKVKVEDLVDHTIQDELNVNSGKRKKRVAFVSRSPPVKKARAEGIVISILGPARQASLLLLCGDLVGRMSKLTLALDNVRTRPPSVHFVFLSSGSEDTDIPASPQVVPLVTSAPTGVNVHVAESVGDDIRSSGFGPEVGALSATPSQGSSADDFYESQTIDSASALSVYVPNWNVTNNARIDNPAICWNLLDHVTPLEKFEAEAAEVIELRKRVSDLEATTAINVGELASFYTKNDATERRFAKHDMELNARIADVRRDMDNDLYPHMLTAIAVRRWVVGHGFRLGLEAGIVHGKAGRSLAQVEAYDMEVEGKYVAAVFEFEVVSFPLLDELECLKDSPLTLIMTARTLKEDQGNKDDAPEFARFQPSIDQVVVPVYSESGFVDREILLSNAIPAICQSVERRRLCSPFISTSGGTSSHAPSYDSSMGIKDHQPVAFGPILTMVLRTSNYLVKLPY